MITTSVSKPPPMYMPPLRKCRRVRRLFPRFAQLRRCTELLVYTCTSTSRSRRPNGAKLAQNTADINAPTIPTISKMMPTVYRLTPDTVASTANARMAPTAIKTMLKLSAGNSGSPGSAGLTARSP